MKLWQFFDLKMMVFVIYDFRQGQIDGMVINARLCVRQESPATSLRKLSSQSPERRVPVKEETPKKSQRGSSVERRRTLVKERGQRNERRERNDQRGECRFRRRSLSGSPKRKIDPTIHREDARRSRPYRKMNNRSPPPLRRDRHRGGNRTNKIESHRRSSYSPVKRGSSRSFRKFLGKRSPHRRSPSSSIERPRQKESRERRLRSFSRSSSSLSGLSSYVSSSSSSSSRSTSKR
eukprot:GHVP01054319.1.p1 GENE.GHVP01054319.1~~GHVP01054319.1.p1  ORF type:complete len:235 (+),score=26.22 GHVP01054319.1:450-1154(+)